MSLSPPGGSGEYQPTTPTTQYLVGSIARFGIDGVTYKRECYSNLRAAND